MSRAADFAERVYQERLRSGDLPELGAGYSREHRAAYAVRQIAERKLGVVTSGRGGHVKRTTRPDPFWEDVASWASAKIVALSEGS